MSKSAYTLLIVESPVIARILQKKAPSFVYVIATGGFCWHPVYNAKLNKLTTRADPQKRNLRKELKEQAKWASSIIIATDNDPAGDFIAWSVLRFLKFSELKRGYLQDISERGIHKLLSNAVTCNEANLNVRLKNRFLVHHEWARSIPVSIQKAGLAAILEQTRPFQTFADEDGLMYKSNRPILCDSEKWITVRVKEPEELYREENPLSTFDVIDRFSKQSMHLSFDDIQVLLQRLFQTELQYSGESLISYPRTIESTFYGDTWTDLKGQYMEWFGSVNDLKPRFLQQTPAANAPHESIHPLNLAITPEQVRGELPQDINRLYEMIYKHTMKTLKMPSLFEKVYLNSAHSNVYFYPLRDNHHFETKKIRPVSSVGELGGSLNRLGIQPASSFGKNIDKWLSEKWITLDNGAVKAGSKLLPYIECAESFRKKLTSLLQVWDDPQLKPETVKALITS